MKKIVVLLLLFVLSLSTVAFAASPWTEQKTYKDKAFYKLDFGIKNLFGGWTEIVTQPWNHHANPGETAESIARGIYNAVVYTVGGALHIVTFPITNLDVPLPNNGVSM